MISLSIVSHGQSELMRPLLDDLIRLKLNDIEVIITINIPEDESGYENLPFVSKIIRNTTPKGFGENHNYAFQQSNGNFFIVVNPDIRLNDFKMSEMLAPLDDPKVGVVGPLVMDSSNKYQDSARKFPTVRRIVSRLISKHDEVDYAWGKEPFHVDWMGGMFLIFRRETFANVGGFDHQRFFMYFEDVDICERLWRCGYSVVLQPRVCVVHDAQRASRRDMKHLIWHLTSAIRYFGHF